jgi:uncharacterized membrane protein
MRKSGRAATGEDNVAAIEAITQQMHEAEARLLEELRGLRKRLRDQAGAQAPPDELTLGQRVADKVAATMGS